ncbi:hypothetical protein D9M68_667950 [compost metagenome]
MRRLPCPAGQGLARQPPPVGHAGGERGQRARRLRRRQLQGRQGNHALLPQGWRLLGQHPRCGRQGRGFQGGLRLRRRAPAAIPDRSPRRPPAGPGPGLGRGEACLVPPLSGPGRGLQGPAALEPPAAERQLHVRGVPHHRFQTQLRPGQRPLRQPVEQPGRRLPGLPRPRLEAPGVGGERARGDQCRLRPRPGPGRRAHRGRKLRPLPFPPRPPG